MVLVLFCNPSPPVRHSQKVSKRCPKGVQKVSIKIVNFDMSIVFELISLGVRFFSIKDLFALFLVNSKFDVVIAWNQFSPVILQSNHHLVKRPNLL